MRVLLACAPLYAGDGESVAASQIERLQKDLAAVEESESTMEQRRLLKRVIRRGESLLKESGNAPERFAVLAVVFRGQQALFALDESDRNREGLLTTCRALAAGPDEQARHRLPADIMLTQIAIASPNEATNVAEAIAGLVDRYKGTDAEAECLMTATLMAMSAGEAELLAEFRKTLQDNFMDVPKVIAFLRERYGTAARDYVFCADLIRADGVRVRLPIDRIGRPYLICFWSEEVDNLDERLCTIQAVQRKYPHRFEVFSVNLDELRDHGQRTLRKLGLDWIPIKAPGGQRNELYLKYGHMTQTPFSFVAVNEHGYARGKSNRGTMPSPDRDMAWTLSSREIALRDPSFFARMQSLVIGDWLVADPPEDGAVPSGIPAKGLRAIQACFPPPAKRCRLTKAEALANYRKAESLCAGVIENHSDARDISLVRERRIIALMGLWKLKGEEAYLERALAEAKNTEGVVAEFCKARHAIREERAEAEKVLATYITACGGDNASGAAHAAAVVLTLDAGDRDLYLAQRDIIMKRFDADPKTWPVASFFLPRASTAAMFDANGIHGVNTRSPWDIRKVPYRMFRAELTTLAGKTLNFPADTNNLHNVVVFVDPSCKGEMAGLQQEYLAGLDYAVKHHRHKEMKLVIVFLTDDPALARSVVSRNRWGCETVVLPSGINHPLSIRHGAFANDRLPKTYVIGPDGRITGTHDGLQVVRDYHGELQVRRAHSKVLQVLQSVKGIIREYDANLGKKALAAGNYSEAANRLAMSFPGRPDDNRYVRECVEANMALGNWEAALESSNAACRQGKMGRPYFLTEWASDLTIRASILERLHRSEDARKDRKKAAELNTKAAEVWEERVVTMVKQGQSEKAERWRVEAKRARAHASQLEAASR